MDICYSSPTYDDEGEMETERDTTEQEETLLDNDKQPWISVIVLPPMMMKVKWKEKETQLNKKKVC